MGAGLGSSDMASLPTALCQMQRYCFDKVATDNTATGSGRQWGLWHDEMLELALEMEHRLIHECEDLDMHMDQ